MSSSLIVAWRARPLRRGCLLHGEHLFAGLRSAQYLLPTHLRFDSSRRYSGQAETDRPNDSYYTNKSGASHPSTKPYDGSRVNDAEEGSYLPPSLKYKSRKGATSEALELEEELERSVFASSALVPRLNMHGAARQQHRIARKHHRAISAQVYHERDRKAVGASSIDWRQVLELMAASTPVQSLDYIEDGITVDVARDVLDRIMEDAGDATFGAIRRRTGAAIKVSRDGSKVMLSGSRWAINMATEEFKNLAKKITVTRNYRPLGPGEAGTEELDSTGDIFVPARSRDEGARSGFKRLTAHVYSIPMPKQWTPVTIREYVISLVDTYTAEDLHSPIYSHDQRTEGVILTDHERAVMIRLVRLFHTLPFGDEVSCSVVKLALSHLTSKGDKYGPQIRGLFNFFDRRGIPMDADVFNILLWGPVTTRNLRKFKQTIVKMTERNFAPNLDTWALFLRMFESVEIKSYILQAMNAKNMLGSPEAIRHVAHEMAPYDAEHAAIQGKSLETYLQEQEARYGRTWLTRIAGNKALHAFCQYERHEDACRLLDLMGERWFHIPESDVYERSLARPGTASFRTIINDAWVKGKVPLAVNVLRKMKTYKLAKQPDAGILDDLFKLAWRANLRSTIAVIWRYATLARLTSYGMRRRVAMLLSGDVGFVEDQWDMTASTYHKLGGATLAHELVGGREVLEQMKALCTKLWGPRFPREKLGDLAWKLWPTAFEDRAPAIPLGTVLCQSILLDYKFLRARKVKRSRDLLTTAKVKSVPLWKRRKGRESWVDVGPVERTEPSEIKHNDMWVEDWESEGWEEPTSSIVRRLTSSADTAGSETHSAGSGAVDGPQANAKWTDGEASKILPTSEPFKASRMVMINPHVWNDEAQDVSATGTDHKTAQQQEDEQACLSAMETLRKERISFKYVFVDRHAGDEGPEGERRMNSAVGARQNRQDLAGSDEGWELPSPSDQVN